jgi:enterochelin esterase-like enzyme
MARSARALRRNPTRASLRWRGRERSGHNGCVTSLSVISVGFVGALVGGSILLWAAVVVIARRRRGRRLLVSTLAVSAVFASLLSAADMVNAHYEYLPRVSDVLGQRDWPTLDRQQLVLLSGVTPATPPARAGGRRALSLPPRGAVISIRTPDDGVGFAASHALVYLPPQYFTEPQARFPVTYLLHGSPGVPVDWLRGAGAATAGERVAASGEPQILVMPTVSRDWLDDSECVDGSRTRVETYVIQDVVPAVDAQLRTRADRADRTVGGMSAGGYCALNLGLRHRDVFANIIDMSGYTHPTHSGGMPALFGRVPDLAQIVAANSPDAYAATLTSTPATHVYFLCGTADHSSLAEMSALRAELSARGITVSWHTRHGGHTYGVWRPGLLDALRWSGTQDA